MLKNPPVLILDEATSSVDNETEVAIQRSMERIIIGRTTIVIAHRLSTVRNADMIYVMENGELSEWGRHDELVAAGWCLCLSLARANRRCDRIKRVALSPPAIGSDCAAVVLCP